MNPHAPGALRHAPSLHAVALASLWWAFAAAAAETTLEGGYEIHRQGVSPHVRQSMQDISRGLEAICAREGIAFKLSGDLGTVGNYEIVEHHHPGERKSSVVRRYTELASISRCHHAVRQREITRITHYDPRRRTVFTREIDPVRGPRPWSRERAPHLSRESVDMLRESLALDAFAPQELRSGEVTIASAPDLKDDRIAGQACRWVHTPAPIQTRRCLLHAGIGMPIDESLSAELISPGVDGPVVLTRVQVVHFAGPVDIPTSVFEPGEIATAGKQPADARRAGCREERAGTGASPCTESDEDEDEDSGDDGDALTAHFDALIQEWCAHEAGRTGTKPCDAGGADFSDRRVQHSMTAWCAQEAARTGMNRCVRRSHE